MHGFARLVAVDLHCNDLRIKHVATCVLLGVARVCVVMCCAVLSLCCAVVRCVVMGLGSVTRGAQRRHRVSCDVELTRFLSAGSHLYMRGAKPEWVGGWVGG